MACEYVDKTVAGDIDADNAVGRMLADAVSSIPKIDNEVFDKMFNSKMQVRTTATTKSASLD